MKNWKLDFKKAFLSSFKDEDLCDSCINWIDTYLIKYNYPFDSYSSEQYRRDNE